MTSKILSALAIIVVAGSYGSTRGGAVAADAHADGNPSASASAVHVDPATFDRIVARWANRPRLGAREVMAKYGMPAEATPEMVIWKNAGPYKRVTVWNIETPHDFPLPHVDFMEHTINYTVPQDKIGDLLVFDGSSTINRTTGELSARCDLEGHNVLTLNLDNDIIQGRKNVEQARQAFGEIVQQDVAGKHPAYVEALQFQPMSAMAAAFSDAPVIPGSPVRPGEPEAKMAADNDGSSPEILATVIAIDLNEVNAAAQAEVKKISAPVLAFAKYLHEEHGMNAGQTMQLAQQMRTMPLVTPAVENMQKKGAGELAMLVTRDGRAFERAYVAAMVKGHVEALGVIDGKLRMTSNDALKRHLTETRQHVAAHLERAQSLQRQMP